VISRSILFSLVCLALGACAQEEAPEFCTDHALFHADHAESNAAMLVTMTVDGRVQSQLQIPRAGIDENRTRRVLQDAGSVYTLQTESECGLPIIDLRTSDDMIVATYTSECGADNKLGQVDVQLFETLPGLDEIEVSVVTPVTQKYFAINRQCASAIFRLE
jgi:hypothetical protein